MYHIGLLIMSALAYLAPEFLKEGRLCWLRSPLYVVTNGKKKSYYFTDEEFNRARGSVRGEVERCKGLGALDIEDARESMFSPEYQRLETIEYSSAGHNLLIDLMSSDVSPRKKFIFDKVDFSQIAE